MNWHYSKNGQTLGPTDAAALARLIQDGDLSSNDLVWQVGWADWRDLGQVEEFAQFFQNGRPATPPPLPARASASIPPATKTRTFGGIECVWCPPGTFLMGSPEDEEDRFDDETPHHVTLTRGFWIGKYPVTQRQWLRVMRNNPSEFLSAGLDAPVDSVSWNDAQLFCSTVSRAEEIRCRLPTEAEWEYACRAGSSGKWCFGDSREQLKLYAWNDYYGSDLAEHDRFPNHLVGQKKPNSWGIYDMHGNVGEWCADWYAPYPAQSTTDPQGPKIPPRSEAADLLMNLEIRIPKRSFTEIMGFRKKTQSKPQSRPQRAGNHVLGPFEASRVVRGFVTYPVFFTQSSSKTHSAARGWAPQESAGKILGFRVVVNSGPL
jgi:formylglycine-generating enzyme required for sulfatase activity